MGQLILQLSVVAILLQKVFETNDPFAVAGIACEPSIILFCVVQVIDHKQNSSPFFSAAKPIRHNRGRSVGLILSSVQGADVESLSVVNKSKRRHENMVRACIRSR